MRPGAIETISPLAADLRSDDPDRYLATLFAPPDRRESLIALYAFDRELARLQRSLREPMAGLIRLQWWDEVLDDIESPSGVNHPVVQGLRRAVARDALDVAHLKRALDGRRRSFEEDMPEDVATFEQYLLDSGGAIACAAAGLLGADDAGTLALAARVGLVSAAWEQQQLLVSSVPDRKPWLPAAWCAGRGQSEENQPHRAAAARLAAWALAELGEARRRSSALPRSLLPAFFPGTLAGIRLRDPERFGRRSFLPAAVPRLAWCWLRGRF